MRKQFHSRNTNNFINLYATAEFSKFNYTFVSKGYGNVEKLEEKKLDKI